jgi:hypothetical protein
MGGERGASISGRPNLSLKSISAGGGVGYLSVRPSHYKPIISLNWPFLSTMLATIAYLQLPWLISFRINEKMFPITTV